MNETNVTEFMNLPMCSILMGNCGRKSETIDVIDGDSMDYQILRLISETGYEPTRKIRRIIFQLR